MEQISTSIIKTGEEDSLSCSATAGLSQQMIGTRKCFSSSPRESDVDLERSSVSGVLAHGLAVIRRPGGLPIKRGGKVEGAIGVSGAPTDEQDEECARRGVEVIGPIKHKAERESI